ncbi:MAG: hypothetical protein QNJ89_08615 [Acidimicrobiia bacterium]|nr:hypothetical protein [Acidimicrobiia bacterium]
MLDTPREDQITVEADTVEAALAEISTTFGEDAEIMRAQKVHRGGVGGFFAKEMVQLTARRRRQSAIRPSQRPAAPPSPVPNKPEGDGIAGVLERMAQDADAADGDFRTVLRRELETGPVNTGSEGLLAAVGWETEANEDAAASADTPTEPPADHVVSEFVDADGDVDEVPEPVTVGPVLEVSSESPEVAPVFPEVPAAAPVIEPEDVNEVIEVEPTTEPVTFTAPVVPFDITAQPNRDEGSATEPEPQLAAAETQQADEPAEDYEAPPGMGRVDWSTTALLRLGMPAPVIEAVAELDPQDDLDWIDNIAEAVAPHCGALPTENVIVVGPHAERLAEPLGLPLVHAGEMAPYDGSFCAMVEDTSQDREWLEYVQGGRGIHLVIGDEPWQDLMVGEPVAVSWVGETAVSDALYLAFTLGATLGYGTVDGFVSSMVRAQPTDVALAVRRIVGRR